LRIGAIADEETITGFMLAGLKEAYVARDRFETEKALKKLFNTPDIVVIFITFDLAKDVRELIDDRRHMGEFYPIVVEIPPASGEMKEDAIRMIVKRAVGVDMEKESA
jgi:V/A-type H+-transporting ATPase subunit F